MKMTALVFDGKKKPKPILIDSGTGPLECRISETLPGMHVIGVFTYPALQEICIHVRPEAL